VRSPSEGSVSVEVALVLPAVLGIVGLILQTLLSISTMLTLTSLAQQAASDLNRSVPVTQVRASLGEVDPEIILNMSSGTTQVCVGLSKKTPWPLSLVHSTVSVRECVRATR
jgi:hypothetical protein